MDYKNLFSDVLGDNGTLESKLKSELSLSAFESFQDSVFSINEQKRMIIDKSLNYYSELNTQIDTIKNSNPTKLEFMNYLAKLIHPKSIKPLLNELVNNVNFKSGYVELIKNLVDNGFGDDLKMLSFDNEVFIKLTGIVFPKKHDFFDNYKNYLRDYKLLLEAIKKYSIDQKDNRTLKRFVGLGGAVLGGVSGIPFLGTFAKQFISDADMSEFLKALKKAGTSYDKMYNSLIDYMKFTLSSWLNVTYILYGGLLIEVNRIQKSFGREIITFDINHKIVVATYTDNEKKRILEWFEKTEEICESYIQKNDFNNAKRIAQNIYHRTLDRCSDGDYKIEQIGDIQVGNEQISFSLRLIAYSGCAHVEAKVILNNFQNREQFIRRVEKFLNEMYLVPLESDDQVLFEIISKYISVSIELHDTAKIESELKLVNEILNYDFVTKSLNGESFDNTGKSSSENLDMVTNFVCLIGQNYGVLMMLLNLYYTKTKNYTVDYSSNLVKIIEGTQSDLLKDTMYKYKAIAGKDEFYKFIKNFTRKTQMKKFNQKFKRIAPKMIAVTIILVITGFVYLFATGKFDQSLSNEDKQVINAIGSQNGDNLQIENDSKLTTEEISNDVKSSSFDSEATFQYELEEAIKLLGQDSTNIFAQWGYPEFWDDYENYTIFDYSSIGIQFYSEIDSSDRIEGMYSEKPGNQMFESVFGYEYIDNLIDKWGEPHDRFENIPVEKQKGYPNRGDYSVLVYRTVRETCLVYYDRLDGTIYIVELLLREKDDYFAE